MRALVVVVVAGCGRVGFDARSEPPDGPITADDASVIVADAAPGTDVRAPTLDTYLQSTGGGPNGTAPDLIVGHGSTRDYYLMYRFDLGGLPPSVAKASLYLVAYASGGSDPFVLDAHRVTENWEESATWNTSAPNQAWPPGGAVAPAIYATTVVTPGDLGGYEWDVTALVNEWLAGTSPNFGLQLRCTTFPPSPSTMVFGAREVSSEMRRPELRITP